jgi:predicted nucleic acid-binding protein
VPEGPVVSNTSPLINLAGVGLLDLLPQLYGDIWVPEVVLAEYVAKANVSDPQLDTLPWLQTKHGSIEQSLRAIRGLGLGEAAAISLAISSAARITLLDDRLGRRIAIERGLPIVGSLGVLLRAKREGIIPMVEPIVNAMIGQGRYISANLRNRLLRDAGETPLQ